MKQTLTKHIDGVWISDGTTVYPPKRSGSFPCITEPWIDDNEQTQGSVRVMTTTHEQIYISNQHDHYKASIWAGRQFVIAEGDTQDSARLSLLDRLITEDDEDIHLSGPIVQELIEHANDRAKLHIVRSVREAWSAIRHTDNALTVNLGAGFSAIETAAQIVHGGAEVKSLTVFQWPPLTTVLRTVCDAYPEQSEIRQRLNQLLMGNVK